MASTSLNESLACVALGYVTYKKDHSLEDFHQMITQTSGNLWNQVISRCELSDRQVSVYRNAFSDVDGKINPWISTSYKTATQIINSLNLLFVIFFIFQVLNFIKYPLIARVLVIPQKFIVFSCSQ